MNKNVVVFSMAVAAIIFTFLIFSILAILFAYWGNSEAVKDSLSTISGIFGGITTIGAAIIAAYLFNDWRIQERTTFIRSIAYEIFELNGQLIDLMQGYPASKDYNFVAVKLMHTKITTKLAIINRQVEDPKMKIVNANFGLFINEFFDILKLKVDEHIDHKLMKELINDLIKSYRADLNYIAELTDIKKLKN
ncbi:hypothetical protein AWW72_16300 [Acinetobacter sp. NRRL B-65365]|uniref:hypothetical protein n=1 Tax=Acinetobacter sp. NRRL B-65365 TaxID=1785092 RepID=UPI0007A0163B|nr:hypothetical protein [Acinetobacter sp. NRRL B-65365]KYQ82944.1 hypothetical protein AWW72_16300 [Acinetobacter sp. NRRL B-65365]